MDVSNVLESVVNAAEKANPVEADDYIDAEGFIVCGKCNTRRQAEIMFPFPDGTLAPRKVKVKCSCREAADRVRKEKEAKDRQMKIVESLRSQSLMDKRLRDATFENFTETEFNKENAKKCRKYAECFDTMLKRNQGLLLFGDVGTGKTYAAACIANYLLERKVPVVMTSFVKLIESVKTMESETVLMSKLNKAQLLIIDDLGAERNTDFALEKVYNIVDSRYRARMPVIFTSNLKLSDMKGTTDIRYARIYDRIFELCYPIQFTGKSWRKAEASRRFDEMEKLLEET